MTKRALLIGLLTTAIAAPAAEAAEPATPIPDGSLNGIRPAPFTGSAATPRRIDAPDPPRHPFMAPNGRSNIHSDAYQTDSYRGPGPVGRGTSVRSTLKVADCGSVMFDSRGRIVTICVGVLAPTLELLDPVTLARIDSMVLPPRDPTGLGKIFSDFSGGGYFYLDDQDRAVFSTNSRHILVVAVKGDQLVTERDYDVTGAVPADDKLYSALPDWSGRLWFITAKGRAGTLDRATGTLKTLATGEAIANSFAVDADGGVYVVTDKKLYRFGAMPDGSPQVVWSETYRNSGIAKPGQVGAGSGTTPTIMERGRVAITDNADPMNVAVYKRGATVGGSRVVCEQPVFRKGASATDNSLITARNSLVVENNYGYSSPQAVNGGNSTAPGMERVDVNKDGKGCRTVWKSNAVAPTVVPKLSLANGLIYAYTKPPRKDRADAWYLTALDFCTGEHRFSRLAGSGLGFNNNYAPVTLGPDGSAYVGVLGGLVRFADSTPPQGAPDGSRAGCSKAPRLRLSARRVKAKDGTCALRASVGGADRALVRRVRFGAGRRSALDRRRPFGATLRSRSRAVRATVRMRDGKVIRLRAKLRRCGS